MLSFEIYCEQYYTVKRPFQLITTADCVRNKINWSKLMAAPDQ